MINQSPFENDISFKTSSSPIAILDTNFNFVDANQSAQNLLGFSRNEVLGKNILDYTVASEYEINYEAIKQLTKGEIPHYKAIRKFTDKTGKLLNFEIIISLLRDPKSSQIYFSGLFSKLSLLKTKKIIDIDDEKLNAIIEQSPILQYILDINEDVNIYENKSLLNYLGYNISDLGNYTEFDFLDTKIPIDYFHQFKTAVNNFKHSKKPNDILEIEYPIYNSKRDIVWIYDKSVALKVEKNGRKKYSYGTIIDITDRKSQEQKIKDQQIFIEKIGEAIPEFIYTMGTETQGVFFSNKRSKQVLGYTEEEFDKITREEIVHPAFFVSYYNKLSDVLKSTNKKTYVSKLKLLHKTKGYRWFKVRTIVFSRDENKLPKILLRIVEDINQNEIILTRNNEQQNFIKNITSKLPATVYVYDFKSNKILFSNVRDKNIFGYTNNFWLNNAQNIIHKDYSTKYKENIHNFFNQTKLKTIESELLIKHKTKGYRWFKNRVKVIKRDIHNKPEQVLQIFDDIDEVKLKNIKISQQEDLIKTITNSMSNFQYLCDIEKGIYTYTNFDNRKILGYTKKEYLGKSSRFVHTNHKEKLNLFTEEVKNNISKNSFRVEILVKHKKGHFIWIIYKVIVLKRYDNGKPSQILEIVEDINETKKKAIKISEQQDLIEKISTSIPEFIYLKNYRTNKLIFSNNKANEILGYDDIEFVSTQKEFFVESSHIEKLNLYQKSIQKEKDQNVFSIDLLIKHKTKGYRWFKNTTIIFERGSKKDPLTTLELVQDIHLAKQNEEQIIEQQRFIENVSSTVPQYLSVYDLESKKCLYTNFENKLIFGYTQKEYLAASNVLIHPDYRDKTTYLADNMVNSKGANYTNAIEFQIYDKNRGYIWANLKILVTRRNEAGLAIQALEILEDIDKTKKSFNKIIEQQNFIQKVASTIPNIIQVLKLDSRTIIYSNFDKRTFLGYGKQEWEQLKLDVIHQNHYKKYIGKVQELIMSKSNELINNELLIKDKNGEYKWVLAINSIFKINENDVDQLMTVFTDINETKILQLQLEKQLSKNIELERFASITSHDLKEPLRTLGNYAQILQSGYSDKLDNDAVELVDHIAKSSKRMDELINDILDFSKIQTDGKKFEKIELNELITIVLDDLKDLISESKTNLNIVNLPVIEGDKTQLRQVFQNLISNAIKFTKDKTPIINIDIELVDDKYVFSVEDNGIGIKETDQNNIFKIFKKLHRQNEFEGQGIGLSICKRIIERHEGEIWLYSKEGEGTTFYFSIPKTIF